MTLEDRLKDVISSMLGIRTDQIRDDSEFIADMGADSLDTVEILMAAEEEFSLDITDEEAEKIKTFKDAIDLIKSKGITDTYNPHIPPPPKRIKFQILFKTPDVLEQLVVDEEDKQHVREVLKRWIQNEEYVNIEFDIDNQTARVVPLK